MVTAVSCNLSEENRSNNPEKQINEKERNVSFAYIGRSGSGMAIMDICQSYVKDQNLYIETNKSGDHTYPLTDIKEEYVGHANNHKVSCVVLNGKFEPVILEKSPYNDFEDADSDQRKFMIRGILKDSQINEPAFYSLFYYYLFCNGYTKPASQVMLDGDPFFYIEDFKTEISQPMKGGQHSPIMDENERLMWCQALYDADAKKLILRLEDGRTYRYPLALFSGHAEKKVKESCVSAILTQNGNLFPADIVGTGAFLYYNSLVRMSHYYFNYGNRYDIEEAKEFLENQGIPYKKMGSLIFTKGE